MGKRSTHPKPYLSRENLVSLLFVLKNDDSTARRVTSSFSSGMLLVGVKP